jgi:hypothetical protein
VGVRSALALINGARAQQEGLPPLRFNLAKFDRLSTADQLFVLTNLERVSRGEVPIYGLTAQLNYVAGVGALLRRDPLEPVGWRGPFQSVWSGAQSSRGQAAFLADFGWMYEDGPPPYYLFVNLDCARRGEAGCWGHRDALLETTPDVSIPLPITLVAGASGGPGTSLGASSETMAFGWVVGVPRSGLTFTWAQAVKYLGLPLRDIPTTTTTTSTTSTTTSTSTTTTLAVPQGGI